jgi:fructoselysine-6-P-deglycase FrlB-like protein
LIKKFKPQKPISKTLQNQLIFCGTGDSFVAALLTEVFSNFNVRAYDPLELINNKYILQNKRIFLVSISGSTRSNIRLARTANDTVAVTTNPNSELSLSCKKTIILDYPSSGVFTSGSIGFLASALTCISLVTKFSIKGTSRLFLNAQKISKKVRLTGRIFVLGNMHTFPISMYFVAKLYEVLGSSAQYERIEQFSHMGLFSARKGDTVFIFDGNSRYNTKLKKNLKKAGLNVVHLVPNTRKKIEQICYYVFVSQLIPLFHAKRMNQKQCFFVNAKKLRNASSEMIY